MHWRHLRCAAPEFRHDSITLFLHHLSMHRGDGEVGGPHLFRQPVDLSAGVAEDDGLGDGHSLVQVAERVELPLLALDGDVKLLDTLKRKLVALDEDADRLAHELLRDLQYLGGHRGGQEDDLDVLGKELEDCTRVSYVYRPST